MPSGLKGYNFYLDGVKKNAVPIAEDAQYQIPGLTPNTDYSTRITVSAVDNAGNETTPVTLASLDILNAITPPPAPTSPELSGTLKTAIDTAVAEQLTPNTKVDGAIIGIVSPDGQYFKAYGTDRTKPLTLDMKMRYGSISKMWCSLLVLKQIDDGHLSLDDTVDMYLDGIPNGHIITVKNLLMSNSGLRDYLQQDPAVGQAYFLTPTATFDPLNYIRNSTPMWPPGHPPESAFDVANGNGTYSNSNWVLQARILEKLDAEYGTGRDYRTIILEDSCVALGLDSVEWPPIGVNYMTEPYARGWAWNMALPQVQATLGPFYGLLAATGLLPSILALVGFGGVQLTPDVEMTAVSTSWPDAAGSLDGNIADLVKFGQAIAAGDLLSEDMVALRDETFTTYLKYTPTQPWHGPGWMGFGLGVISWGQWYGWIGNLAGYHTAMLANPDNGAVVAVMMPYIPTGALDLTEHICYLLYPESTLKARPQIIRVSEPPQSVSTVYSPALYAYQAPGDEDNNAQVPLKVPFYV